MKRKLVIAGLGGLLVLVAVVIMRNGDHSDQPVVRLEPKTIGAADTLNPGKLQVTLTRGSARDWWWHVSAPLPTNKPPAVTPSENR